MLKKLLLSFMCITTLATIHADSTTHDTKFFGYSTLCESIFKQHLRLLHNTRITHKPLVVCFSGVPGMGIPEVARMVEQKCGGVRVNNDDIRAIIKGFEAKLSSQILMQAYLIYFLLSYSAPNRFLILDSSIDRKYSMLFPYLVAQGIPYIVVRMEMPHEQVVQTLTEREQAGDGIYLKFLPQWYADYDSFGQSYPATIVIKNSKNKQLVLDELINLIQDHLR